MRLFGVAGACVLTLLGLACSSPVEPELTFLADFNILPGTDFDSIGSADKLQRTAGARVTAEELQRRKSSGAFGGISAIVCTEDGERLFALSDSTRPVMFSFEIAIDEDGFRLLPRETIYLRDEGGGELLAWTLDPEGLAPSPDGGWFLSSEGFTQREPPVDPAILEFGSDGLLRRRLPLPERFLYKGEGEQTAGVRPNQGFESLTLTADGSRLVLANEGPLVQDGPDCGPGQSCTVRIVEYEIDSGAARPGREFAYEVDATRVPADYADPADETGLVELIALNGAGFLALERGFVRDRAGDRSLLSVRLYQVDLSNASDVSEIASLAAARGYRVAEKRLLLDLDEVVESFSPGFRRLDNFEGACLGPRLPDGGRALILVSDDNYSEAQRTSFLLFRLALESG